jgi:hypothetical protein
MITKETAVNLVNKYESEKKAKAEKEANDYVENVVSLAIEVKAKQGICYADCIIPTGINSEMVCDIILQHNFKIVHNQHNVREIHITWEKEQ